MDRSRIPVGGILGRDPPRIAVASPELVSRAPFLFSGIHAGDRRPAARTRPFRATRCISVRPGRTGGILARARGGPACPGRDRGLALLLSGRAAADVARRMGGWG